MKTTIEWLDAARAASEIQSDYALAKALGITRGALSSLRNGRTHLADTTAVRIAELAGVDPLAVIASAHIEREAKRPAVRQVWEDLLRRVGSTALVAAVAIGGAAPSPAEAGAKPGSGSAVCIMSNRRRTLKSRWFSALATILNPYSTSALA